jgi:hypothetical protein
MGFKTKGPKILEVEKVAGNGHPFSAIDGYDK